MHVAKRIEAEGRNELIDRIPKTLGTCDVIFTPVALDTIYRASLDVEVDYVGSHTAVGQQRIIAFQIQITMCFADHVTLALKGHVEALGFRQRFGDFVWL